MQFKELWEKVKKYDYKKLLCARNYVIAGCVALLVVAVILNATLGGSGGDEDVLGNESTKILGNSVLTDANADGNEGTDTETAEDFFASAVINRQRVRDEAMETLRQVARQPRRYAGNQESGAQIHRGYGCGDEQRGQHRNARQGQRL